MDTTDQAIFVVQVILALGPLALYFLGLGLVNSQARPCMVSARFDFILLAVAFVPLLAAPLILLAEHGRYHLISAALAAVLVAFFSLLPRRNSGWVIYNCSPAQCRRVLQQACRQLGWALTHSDPNRFTVEPGPLSVSENALPWLRSVTLQVDNPSTVQAEAARNRLVETLREELSGEATLPSATGISLVLIGTGLLGLPMWYLFHHMPAIVNLVRQIFPA